MLLNHSSMTMVTIGIKLSLFILFSKYLQVYTLISNVKPLSLTYMCDLRNPEDCPRISVLSKVNMVDEAKDTEQETYVKMQNRANSMISDLKHVWEIGSKNAEKASSKNQFLRAAQVLCCILIVPGSAACKPVAGWLLNLVAVLALVYGMALMTSAIKELMIGDNLSFASEPVSDQIIMTGPYDVVRHPIYGGTILVCLGISIMTSDIWRLLITMGLFLASNARIESEERYLVEKFGESYEQYVKSVKKKLLPLIF